MDYGTLVIDPRELRRGDLLVDDDGNAFAEVLSVRLDASGSVWVEPVPCTFPLDVEFPAGVSVTVLR